MTKQVSTSSLYKTRDINEVLPVGTPFGPHGVFELVNQLQNEPAAGRSAAIALNVTHDIYFKCRSCREDLQTCISFVSCPR